MPPKPIFLKISAICGILSPIIAITFISIAVHFSPWFSHRENWFSELGGEWNSSPIYSSRGISSILFNFGLMLSGIFGIIFALGIKKSNMFSNCETLNNAIKNKYFREILKIPNLFGINLLSYNSANLGTNFLIIAMFSLFGVGIFPVTILIMHIIFGITLFLTIPFALIFIGIGIRNSEKILGNFILILGIVSLIVFPLLLRGKAIAELISAFGIFLFCVIFSIKLFNKT